MGKIYIISLILLISFCLSEDKNKEVFEVSSENKETKSVLDIKKFLECAQGIKDFPEYSNFIKVLEHKKGYTKQQWGWLHEAARQKILSNRPVESQV